MHICSALFSLAKTFHVTRVSLRACTLQVRQEQVSGEVQMSLLGSSFGNMYQNLSNILLTIVPKAAADVPAVLVNAHFDTAIGSPGQLPRH